MKSKLIGVLFAGLSFCMIDAAAQQAVYARNDKKPEGKRVESPVVYDEVTSFIINSAATRMMIAEEGRIASKEGTTESIRLYGELMVKDQGRLLGELKRLAILKNITLPEYQEKTGGEFNSSFIRAMSNEHEQTIRMFRKAAAYGDPEVSEFAKRYLPVVESHLKRLKSVRKN